MNYDIFTKGFLFSCLRCRLVLSVDDYSINIKNYQRILIPFLHRIRTDSGKIGDIIYHFIGPEITSRADNICNNYIIDCIDNWKNIKFDVFINEHCPHSIFPDIIQLIL